MNIATRLAAASISGALLLGTLGVPAFAADQPSNLGQVVAACNKDSKDKLKSIRQGFKDKKISKDERNAQVKQAEKDRTACVKDAKDKAKAERKSKKTTSIKSQ